MSSSESCERPPAWPPRAAQLPPSAPATCAAACPGPVLAGSCNDACCFFVCSYLTGNPCQDIPGYRQFVVASLPSLQASQDRP